MHRRALRARLLSFPGFDSLRIVFSMPRFGVAETKSWPGEPRPTLPRLCESGSRGYRATRLKFLGRTSRQGRARVGCFAQHRGELLDVRHDSGVRGQPEIGLAAVRDYGAA